MSFTPVIPLTGYGGWRFLVRTMPAQQQALAESVPMTRATDDFRARIASVKTADDLVADRRLLQVALGAFGLDDDINNRAFIRKVLAEGTIRDDAFANRLTDKRYAALALEFGFGDLGARTGLATFADKLIARYQDKQFERAVGEVNSNMRLALGLSSGLAQAAASTSKRGQWFGVMGNAALRRVMESALGLPASIGQIDIDRQVEAFQDRAQAVFGTSDLADIAGDARMQEKAIRLFLVRSEAASSGGFSSAGAALALLRNRQR